MGSHDFTRRPLRDASTHHLPSRCCKAAPRCLHLAHPAPSYLHFPTHLPHLSQRKLKLTDVHNKPLKKDGMIRALLNHDTEVVAEGALVVD